MKIDNSFKSVTTGAIPDDTERTAKAPATAAAPALQGSRVQLSTQASHMQAIEKGFAATPIVDTARVDQIKEAIANGHFKVDADKVADRLLKTVQELIRAHKA